MTLPSGTVTFLFSDIEGSTRLWEQHPEAMRPALARHDALALSLIARHEGTLIKSRGEGDSLFAVFARATDAVAAACALQQALCAEPWPAETPLRARMALHTGEADLRAGDYYGSAVNRCARLRAIGHGGQVLLSDVTRDLTRDTLPPSASLKSLGAHRLRDLSRPESVFQLLHPVLPLDFPPLASLDNPDLPNNLPVQVTSFIGREKESAVVKRLLSTTRLLTLTGAGGCGKTRLALQAAADLLEEYPEGVWSVELAALADPALVPKTVAQALGMREEVGQPLLQTLTGQLKPKRLLLVLDNCEHLLAACGQLADALIRACSNLKILATSREGLGIAGEALYPIPPLSVPDLRQAQTPASLAQYEAVTLFIERATALAPHFAVTDANAPALAATCHRLDGIPLALELAAARVRSLAVEEINARLADRFRLLTGGSRTALPRHQTLRAMLDWSYDLLTGPERTLLHRLSVFAGGCRLEAAETVCAGEGIEACEVLDLLTSLTDKSLVAAEQDKGHTRYRLLETVRQYADDRLRESGEGEALRNRHRDYFLAVAEEAEPKLYGSEQAAWFERLEREHDNLRAAIGGCLEAEDGAEAGLRLVGALPQFWIMHKHGAEGWALCERMLAHADLPHRTAARARALSAAAMMVLQRNGIARPYLTTMLDQFSSLMRNDIAMGRPRAEESLALFRELGDRVGIAEALYTLGDMAILQGDFDTARACLEQSLALRRELDHRRGTAGVLRSLGLIAFRGGDMAAAQSLLEEAVSLARAEGDSFHLVINIGSLLMILGTGDTARARALLEDGQALCEQIEDRHIRSDLFEWLSDLAVDLGDLDRALALYEAGYASLQEAGNKAGMAGIAFTPGHVHMLRGNYAAARACYDRCAALMREAGMESESSAHLDSGLAVLCQEDGAGVPACLTEVIRLYQANERKTYILNALDIFAGLAVKQGRQERAARLFGAIESQDEALNVVQRWARPFERRLTADLRDTLDRERYAVAWQEGRAMTLDQAIAYALEEAGT
jgi:predicted ATPase/class 3 adenylate cyclase